ncbi:MAG TPA: hypothetical protein VNU97_20190 [Rhizomicrobium sp.]|jgi:hypothetical protein|nr:hypothetical protein [Rhizomicrobium sp.]
MENKDQSLGVAAPAEAAVPPVPLSTEALCASAAEKLHAQLDIGLALLRHCQSLAHFAKGDRSLPVAVAARVMQSNVATARGIAPAANGETRHRSIVQAIPPPDRKKQERKAQIHDELEMVKVRERLSRRLDELVEQSVRARSGDSNECDRVAQIVESDRKTVAHLEKNLAELED